jgi:hypothetical protein
MATLYETQTIYSLRDVHDMLEIAAVDARNREILNPPRTR